MESYGALYQKYLFLITLYILTEREGRLFCYTLTRSIIANHYFISENIESNFLIPQKIPIVTCDSNRSQLQTCRFPQLFFVILSARQ